LNLTATGNALDFVRIVRPDPKYAGNLLTNICRSAAMAHAEYDMAIEYLLVRAVRTFPLGGVRCRFVFISSGRPLPETLYYLDILYRLEISEYK
jgi:hypothetical protein